MVQVKESLLILKSLSHGNNYCLAKANDTVSGRDYSSLSTYLTFAPGSGEGTERCSPITANDDSLVESEEEFSVILDIVTSSRSNLHLGNTETSVIITDTDGMYVCVIR